MTVYKAILSCLQSCLQKYSDGAEGPIYTTLGRLVGDEGGKFNPLKQTKTLAIRLFQALYTVYKAVYNYPKS